MTTEIQRQTVSDEGRTETDSDDDRATETDSDDDREGQW